MTHGAPRLVALFALALFATACHGGSDTASTTTRPRASSTSSASTLATTVAPTTTSSSSVSTTSPPTGPCGRDDQPDNGFQIGAPADTLLLTSVTIRATARCTDEVVFGFASTPQDPPGVTISIVQPPFTLAGSGAPVSVAGQRFYKVQFEPASTFDFTSGHPSYTGPTNIVPTGTSHVRQVVNTVAFEGVVTWIVGVGAGDQFLFKETASPPSLILTF